MTTDVFVYGTLKRGQRNHRLLAAAEFLGTAITAPRYRLYDQGRYPCLVDDPDRGVAVHGEVYRVPDDVLHRLDALEGSPHLYSRREIELHGIAPPVLAYFYNGDCTRFADCGDAWPVRS